MRTGGASQKNTTPPYRRTTEPIPLKFGTRIPEVLWYSCLSISAISTGSDIGRPPYELVGKARNKSDNIWN